MSNDAWRNGLRVRIKNTVDFSKIQDIAQKAACEILVGFPSGRDHVPTLHKNKDGKYEGYNGESVADIKPIETSELAKMLHFGAAGIPARPFLEDGLNSKKDELQSAIKEESAKVVEGGTPNWDKIGTMAVGAIQEFVRGDYYKSTIPNSKRTQEYKGSDKPLIDGADLINSLVYVKNGQTFVSIKGEHDADSYQKEVFN